MISCSDAPAETESTLTLKAAGVSLRAYLHLLFDTAPPLLPNESQQVERIPPFLSRAGLHLPASVATGLPDSGNWFRAAVAHAAAHRTFSRHVFVRAGIAPITQALIDLLEDARVEALAWRAWPGLRRLWALQHAAEPAAGADFETLLLRLARALIDPGYDDPHPWVRKGRASFWPVGADRAALTEATDSLLMRRMASALGHDLGQMRLGFNPRLYRPGPAYRDDNRWLWHSDEQAQRVQPRVVPTASGADTADTATPSRVPREQTWLYPEWDRRIGRLRPRWCSVSERSALTPRSGGAAEPDAGSNSALVPLLRAFAVDGRQLSRREREGSEIDLDAAVQGAVARRRRIADDARVYRRLRHKPQSAAAMLLLDISASSADPIGNTWPAQSALMVQKQATLLLVPAMLAAGWHVAVVGFCSNGRHRVELWRVVDFGERWDAAAAHRLAGLKSGWSTRIGAAMRHATHRLMREAATLRLVVVLGDGELHDVDVHEPGYLADDVRAAVQAARSRGVQTLCLVPDDATAAAARQTFGEGGCFVMSGGHAAGGLLTAFRSRA